MIHVEKNADDCPEVLVGEKARAEIARIEKSIEQNELVHPSELQRLFGHSTVRAALAQVYREKCAFCESLGARVVHHYRPLSRYPWLAYDWRNLLPTCEPCHQSAGEGFPTLVPDSATTVTSMQERRASWSDEQPELLHPEFDRPEEHIEVGPEGTLRGLSTRGWATIRTFDLNRRELLDARREIIDRVIAQLRQATDKFLDSVRATAQQQQPALFRRSFARIFHDLTQRAQGEAAHSIVARTLRSVPGKFLDEHLNPDSTTRHMAFAAFREFIHGDQRALADPMVLDALQSVSRSTAETFARWQGDIDPEVQHVFVVSPASASAAGTMNDSLVAIIRSDIDDPRLSQPWENTQFWELPPSFLDDARAGRMEAPSGFNGGRWHEVPLSEPRPTPIAIGSVSLHNFRCFESLDMTFEPGMNVLIGKNGAGKTALLDALAHTLALVICALSPLNRDRHKDRLTERDIRVVPVRRSQHAQSNERRYPARTNIPLVAYGSETLDEYNWQFTHDHGHAMRWAEGTESLNILDLVHWLVTRDHNVPLPVFAYYRTTRTGHIGRRADNGNGRDKIDSRLSGYLDWDSHTLDLQRLEEWFKDKQLLEQQSDNPPGELRAVQEALLACFRVEHFDEFRFDAALKELAARRKSGPYLPFNQLSDGVRNMLGLVADLAMRCVQLNPHLGAQAPQETSGVVLIDELDLHLHPSWQSRVIADLRAAFPRIQFIITTHSPLLVSGLRSSEVTILEQDEAGQTKAKKPEWDPRLLTGNGLFERVFGVEDRPPDPIFNRLKKYEYLARGPYRTEEDETQMAALAHALREEGFELETPVPREPLPVEET